MGPSHLGASPSGIALAALPRGAVPPSTYADLSITISGNFATDTAIVFYPPTSPLAASEYPSTNYQLFLCASSDCAALWTFVQVAGVEPTNNVAEVRFVPVCSGAGVALAHSVGQAPGLSKVELGFEDAIFFWKVSDHLLLVPLDPASDHRDQDMENERHSSGWRL